MKILILFEGINNGGHETREHLTNEIEKHVDKVEYVNDYTHLGDITTFAERSIEAIRNKYGRDVSYSIVGYSFGGMVAQEAAKYAVRQSMAIDCIILIATTAPIPDTTSFAQHTTPHPDKELIRAAVETMQRAQQYGFTHKRTIKELHRAIDPFRKSTHPQLDSLLKHPAVRDVMHSEQLMRLVAVGAKWILGDDDDHDPEMLHTTQYPKVIILSPEFDQIFPADVHIHRIQHAMMKKGFDRFEVVKLEANDHGIQAAAQERQLGAEFVGNCGNLGLDTKLKFLANNKPTIVSLSVAGFTLVLTIILIVVIIKLSRHY